MSRLEEALFWRPTPRISLDQRIYRVAAAMLSLKEFEYLDGPQAGPLPPRVEHLSKSILARIEEKHGLDPKDKIIPERVKACRQKAIGQIAVLRGRLGGLQKNQLETNIRSQQIALENVSASESAIRDADYATEVSALTRAQILVQSTTSILGLANQLPQSALALLGG